MELENEKNEYFAAYIEQQKSANENIEELKSEGYCVASCGIVLFPSFRKEDLPFYAICHSIGKLKGVLSVILTVPLSVEKRQRNFLHISKYATQAFSLSDLSLGLFGTQEKIIDYDSLWQCCKLYDFDSKRFVFASRSKPMFCSTTFKITKSFRFEPTPYFLRQYINEDANAASWVLALMDLFPGMRYDAPLLRPKEGEMMLWEGNRHDFRNSKVLTIKTLEQPLETRLFAHYPNTRSNFPITTHQILVPLASACWDYIDHFSPDRFFHTMDHLFYSRKTNELTFHVWWANRNPEDEPGLLYSKAAMSDQSQDLSLPFLLATQTVRVAKGLGMSNTLKKYWNLADPSFEIHYGAKSAPFSPPCLFTTLHNVAKQISHDHPNDRHTTALLPLAIDRLRVIYSYENLDVSPRILILLYRLINYYHTFD